jgi:hypothetical protein
MRPAIRRITVRVKELYDAKEQGFFGALSGTLDARTSSERLLVGLSGLVLVVGLALAEEHHVNLSGSQPEEPRLVGEVVHALETSRLSPRQLTLEITERPGHRHRGHERPAAELKGSGSIWPSTTSAPATPRSATCAVSRSTCSRSTRRS